MKDKQEKSPDVAVICDNRGSLCYYKGQKERTKRKESLCWTVGTKPSQDQEERIFLMDSWHNAKSGEQT